MARARRRLVHAGCDGAPQDAARRSSPVDLAERHQPPTAPIAAPAPDDVLTGPLVVAPRASLSGPLHVTRR